MTKPIPDKAEVALEYPDKAQPASHRRGERSQVRSTCTSTTFHFQNSFTIWRKRYLHAAARCGTPRGAAGWRIGSLSCGSTLARMMRTRRPPNVRALVNSGFINIGSNKRIMTFFELDLAISASVPLAVITHVQ